MGTDSQYVGVQLGPSEYPSGTRSKKPKRLTFLRAYDESLVQIVQYEANVRNPRFGRPVMYRVTLNDPREQHSGIGLPIATVRVHWSRVIHVADNLNSSEIFGAPRMRPALNRLLDLRKLYGGSAEMYWRGAFPGLSLETQPQLGGDVVVNPTALQDMVEQYQNSLQRYLLLTGMTAKTLAPQVVDPTPQIEVQLTAICIQLGCPKRVFMGSERGELASSQDDSAWNDRLRERQNNYLTPRVIAPFIDRLIQCGVLPEPPGGYHVTWDDLDSLGEKDKAAIALQKSQALAAYVQSGASAVMDPTDYLTDVFGLDKDRAAEVGDNAEQHVADQHEQDMEQQQDQIDAGLAPDPTALQTPPPVAPGQGPPSNGQPAAGGGFGQ